MTTKVVSSTKMPAVFIGHGSPMNAIEDNEFSRAWADIAKAIPTPEAILCVSAHWEANGSMVTAMEHPKTIHDFYGFPEELNRMTYHAPGSPELAQRVKSLVKSPSIKLDTSWGLDHGTWSVLSRMYPKANIPVCQLSLDRTKPPQFHYDLGVALRPLREEGILILGSGNIVHNLGMVQMVDKGYDWALEFDQLTARLITERKDDQLINYESLGRTAHLSIPTNEHYLPLLYVLGTMLEKESIQFFCEKCVLGSISMRAFVGGANQ
jgi:4,5-DOPA dioxygenase extradiol